MLLARSHGIAADPAQRAHELVRGAEPFDESALLLAAKRLGLKARIGKQPAHRIGSANLPALAWSAHGEPPFLVARVLDGGNAVLIHGLRHKRPQTLTRDQFEQHYAGRLLQVASRASVLGELAWFAFTWFVPAVIKYRRLLGEVFAVSLFIQLFALVTPLFYQVVMDKVLVHHAMTTLNMVTIGLLTMAVFDVAMYGLRTYMFAHTTSKIDVELGARLYRHVLNLPLAWFESRRVGDTIARVRELDSIRQFLTGQARLRLKALDTAIDSGHPPRLQADPHRPATRQCGGERRAGVAVAGHERGNPHRRAPHYRQSAQPVAAARRRGPARRMTMRPTHRTGDCPCAHH